MGSPVTIQDGKIHGEVKIGPGSISTDFDPNNPDAATVGLGGSGIVPGGNPLLPGGGEVSTEISISGKGIDIKGGLDSKNVGLGGEVGVDISPGGDKASVDASVGYGSQEIISVQVVKEGCTITVQYQLFGGQSVTNTFTDPKCKKPELPAPSPSPTPSPTPGGNPGIDVSSIGDNCTVYAAWIGKGYEYEHRCYLYSLGADGSKNYYWDVRRQSTKKARGSLDAQFGVVNPGLPDSNAAKYGWLSIKTGEEKESPPDVWMVNVGTFTDTNRMIRSSYSNPTVGDWFVPGNFGATGSLINTGAWFKWAYSLLLTQYPAEVEIDIYVKCPGSGSTPPQKFTPPSPNPPPNWNSPPKNMADKCCNASTSMMRKIIRF
ncbi:MAG TPA: hypothetical protein VK211_02665, partial [Kamptonema sp.]|nr:hypothetical protein [Kamptonema sp.]